MPTRQMLQSALNAVCSIARLGWWVGTTLLAFAPRVGAQGIPLDDSALSQVVGQALLTLSNSSVAGLDFTRITANADMRVSLNLTGVRLGEYVYAPRNATGADIDIGTVHLGRSDTTEDARTVSFSDPYVEFVSTGTGGARQVLGMRLGVGAISGSIGFQANIISGSLLIQGGSAGTLDSHQDPLGGKRWDGTTCGNASACTLSLAQIDGVQAGTAEGPSRDFFISLLKQSVSFPGAPGLAAPDVSQAGVWLNWRDRLNALGTTGIIPPNVGKGP